MQKLYDEVAGKQWGHRIRGFKIEGLGTSALIAVYGSGFGG